MDITSFIPTIPKITDKNLEYDLFRRAEFHTKKLDVIEHIKPNTPFLSQEVAVRFFAPITDYTIQIVYHGMGTGKTCLASLIEENLKNNGVRALYLVPNETLRQKLYIEIAEKCTNDVYTATTNTDVTDISETSIRGRIRRAVSKNYQIETFETFLKHEVQAKDDAYIIKNYSGRLIVVDEVHNFRENIAAPKKQKEEELRLDTYLPFELYNELYRFLHLVERCRILLMTGTPIWDQPYEFASLVNLVLPSKGINVPASKAQPKGKKIDTRPFIPYLPTGEAFIKEYFNSDGNLIPAKAKELKELLRGKVSYLRSSVANLKKMQLGVKEPWLKHIQVYPCGLSEFQEKYAKEAYKKGKGLESRDARQALICVYPDGSYGDEGFKKYVRISDQGIASFRDSIIQDEFKKNLEKYAVKVAFIISMAKRYRNEKIFIYEDSVTGSGGIINIGLLLQTHGFVCARSADAISTPSKTPRFVVISGGKGTIRSDTETAAVIRSFNADDNKYGERCQIIIGSAKISTGVDMFGIRQFYAISGHWNVPKISQALFRTLRATAYLNYPIEEQYLRIFYLVGLYSGKSNVGEGFPEDAGFSTTPTMDIDVYRIAEEKEYRNTRLLRLMKEVAWNCPLYYARNVLSGDQDGTVDCDYTRCNYKCENFPSQYIEKDTDNGVWNYTVPEDEMIYDNLYHQYQAPLIRKLADNVIELFRIYFSLDLYQIIRLLDKTEKDIPIIIQTLKMLIDKQMKVYNRYGFLCYIRENNDRYFLVRDIGSYKYSSLYYIEYPMVADRYSMEEIINIYDIDHDLPLIGEVCKNPEMVTSLNYTTQVSILEETLEREMFEPGFVPPAFAKILLEKYDHFIYRIKSDFVGGKAIVHIMNENKPSDVEYNVAKKIVVTGNKRILKLGKSDEDVPTSAPTSASTSAPTSAPSSAPTSRWKFVDPDIEETIIKMLNTLKKKAPKDKTPPSSLKGPYFGTHDPEKETFKITKVGTTRKGSGQNCKTKKKNELLKIYKDIDYYPAPTGGNKEQKTPSDIMGIGPLFADIFAPLEDKTPEQLNSIYMLVAASIDDLCMKLRKGFEERGLMR